MIIKQSGLITNNNNNMGSTRDRVIDHKIPKTTQDYHQQNKQQNQVPLRCPRCDSINTKFCYYNNYSLSQPRHFCKACKRYWTRGGTLRNVPIGGGYRKNKRVRRSLTSFSSSSSSTSCSSTLDANNSVKNPLFNGLPTSYSTSFDMNFSFSRYNIQNPSQINGFGLGFPSSSCGDGEFRHGFTGSKQSFQDLIFTNPLFSNYTTISTNKSLLGSNNLQIKGQNSFQTLLPSYEDDDLQMKQVKMELEGQIKSMEHQQLSQNYQMDQTMGLSSSDPSLLWVGSSGLDNLGSWLDPTNNIGSSITSLI